MNVKRFVVASLVIFVAYKFLTSFVNVIVFGGIWEVGFTFGDLGWSFLFIFIFIKGYKGKGLPEGIRFGLLIGMFFCSPIIFGFLPLEAITNVNPDSSGCHSFREGAFLVWTERY